MIAWWWLPVTAFATFGVGISVGIAIVVLSTRPSW